MGLIDLESNPRIPSIASNKLFADFLQIKIFAYDQYSHDNCIGIVQQNLEDVNLTEKVEFWRKVFPVLDEKVNLFIE